VYDSTEGGAGDDVMIGISRFPYLKGNDGSRGC
jgi:hypothetical protein